MKPLTDSGTNKRLLTLLIASGALAVSSLAVVAGDSDQIGPRVTSQPLAPQEAQPIEKPVTAGGGVKGQRVYVDPETGKIGPPPAGAPVIEVPSEQQGGGAAAEPLVEVPVEAPAGGVKVDLKRRFRSSVRATRQSDGSVVTECVREGEAGTVR